MPIRATDANQVAIMRALRQIGCSVQSLHIVGRGCPDIVVGFERWDETPMNLLMEIKSGDNNLTPAEVRWHDRWRGQVTTVRTREQAVMIVQRRREEMGDDAATGTKDGAESGPTGRGAAQGGAERGE